MIVVDHNNNTVDRWRTSEWPTQLAGLVATHSTITTAMHLACYLGARSVIMVAADCGDLDGDRNVDGHDKRDTTLETLRSFDIQNTLVKRELWDRYGIPIVGLSPFVTPNMEGHRFVSHAGALNAD